MAYLLNEADEQLVREIEHWLSLADENKALLNELEAAWLESGKLKVPPVVVDVDAAWNKLSDKMDLADKLSQKPIVHLDTERGKSSKITLNFIRVAAVVVLAVGLWSIRNALLKPELQMFASAENVEEVGLSDGSIVSMNENTTMIVPRQFIGKTREVEMEGEAFFDITPDKEKPFIIRAEDAYIKVLGTSFNVKALDVSPQVEVYVEEGMVLLYTIEENTGDTASVLLSLGETGLYDKETREVKKVGETDIEVLYWLNKTLIFEETELWRVFEILELTFDVSITLQDSTVNNCRLNAKFLNERIDYILEVISITFGLEVEKDETTDIKTYFIKGEGCKY